MLAELQEQTSGKNVLILGVGNRSRGDDGIGSYLARRLSRKVTVPVIDGGDVPEKALSSIETSSADLILVVDAADFGATPGEISLLELNELKGYGVSTHTANLALLFNIIPAKKRPRTLLIAVQAGSISGKTLSPEVRNALDGLERLFRQLFKKG